MLEEGKQSDVCRPQHPTERIIGGARPSRASHRVTKTPGIGIAYVNAERSSSEFWLIRLIMRSAVCRHRRAERVRLDRIRMIEEVCCASVVPVDVHVRPSRTWTHTSFGGTEWLSGHLRP